jgi:hypothetical protein
MEAANSTVDIQINKAGPSGRPVAVVTTPASLSLDKVISVIQREITRNNDLRTKLGLKACPACAASGIDLDIRHRYDHVLRVDLGKIG